jgi:hypothetical protein
LKDFKYILLFTLLGLALAVATSAPLRNKNARRMALTPASALAASQDVSDEDRLYVHGTINVAATLPLDVARRTLFIFASAAKGGAPIAVKRIDTPTFPLTFELTAANNMVASGFYEGDLILTARLDQDGAAGPKQPGDVDAATRVPAASDRRISITLAR